jgi:sn-glycerol 3-phosphate transport system ATP-binding protein
MLGAERLVHGLVGAQNFTVRVDATLPAPRNGDTLTLQGAAEHLHWFDAATQHRL